MSQHIRIALIGNFNPAMTAHVAIPQSTGTREQVSIDLYPRMIPAGAEYRFGRAWRGG